MSDLQSHRLIILKGILFLCCGLLAGGILLIERHDLKTVVLLLLTVWCFCRFYYFAFYVIEHYVDSQFRFAGLGDFAHYLLVRRRQPTLSGRNQSMNPHPETPTDSDAACDNDGVSQNRRPTGQ